jgi:hypothetical protein
MFAEFTKLLDEKGLRVNGGKMVDASFTIAPASATRVKKTQR